MQSMPPEPGQRLCIECGYVLDHLTEPRCPECAQAFDLADPTTFRVSSTARPMPRFLMLIGLVHTLVLAVFAFDMGFRIPGHWYPLSTTGYDGLGAWMAFTSPVVLLGCIYWTGWRWLGILNFVLAVIWGLSLLRVLCYL